MVFHLGAVAAAGDALGGFRHLRHRLHHVVDKDHVGHVHLLDFSKMQDGRFTLNIEQVDVQAEFEDTIYTYMELFKQDAIELHYESGDELFPPIPSDPWKAAKIKSLRREGDGNDTSDPTGI